MNLEIVNDVVKAVKGADDTFDFICELKNYVEKIKDNKQKDENLKVEKQKKIEKEKEKQSNLVYVPLEKIKSKTNSNEIEDMLLDSSKTQGKITTKYRDEMLKERRKILEIYAKNTAEKGEMYYIYNRESGFNLTDCSTGKSSIVLKMSESELPEGATLGSVLRKEGNKFVLDEKATEEVKRAIYSSEIEKLKEQRKFLQSKRIEGHIYQIAEKSDKTSFLFDVTSNKENQNQGIIVPNEISLDEDNSINNEENLQKENVSLDNSNPNEAFEEIKFTKKFLNSCNNGDFIIYRDGKYQKY